MERLQPEEGATPAAVAVAANGNVLSITPAAALSSRSVYAVSIPAGALVNAAGIPLAVDHVFSFATARR